MNSSNIQIDIQNIKHYLEWDVAIKCYFNFTHSNNTIIECQYTIQRAEYEQRYYIHNKTKVWLSMQDIRVVNYSSHLFDPLKINGKYVNIDDFMSYLESHTCHTNNEFYNVICTHITAIPYIHPNNRMTKQQNHDLFVKRITKLQEYLNRQNFIDKIIIQETPPQSHTSDFADKSEN